MSGPPVHRFSQALRTQRPLAYAWLGCAVLAVLWAVMVLANRNVRLGERVEASSVSAVGIRARGDQFDATGSGLHAVGAALALKAGAAYAYEFEVDQVVPRSFALRVDLFGAAYDDPARESLHRLRPGERNRTVNGVLPAGPAPPPGSQFRIFYEGLPDVSIRAIRIATISPLRWSLERGLGVLALLALAAAMTLSAGVVLSPSSMESCGSQYTQVAVVYAVLAVLRFLLIWRMPYWSGDEFVYKSLASGIFAEHHASAVRAAQVDHDVRLPNLLYPYVIAPAIALGQEFYTGIRAINVLVVTSAIVPAYAIARRLCTHRVALCIAAIAVLIPSVQISAYAVTEVLYHPVALLALWLALRSVELPRSVVRAIAFGAIVGIALNVRMTALALIPAYLAALFFVALRSGRCWELLRSPAWAAALVAAPVVQLGLRLVTSGSPSASLGVYESRSGGWLSSALAALKADPSGFFALLAGHAAILAVPYSIGIAAGLDRLCRGGGQGDGTDAQRDLTVILCTFLAAFALSIVFTLGVSSLDLGGLERWHSRYYFSYLPMLLLPLFLPARPSELGKFVYFLVLTAILGAASWFLLAFDGLNTTWFGSLVDSMEAHWLKVGGLALACGGFAIAALLAVSKGRPRGEFALLVIAGWILWANIATFRVMQASPGADDQQCGLVAQNWLNQNPGTVAAIARNRADLVDLVFWLPRLPEYVLTLPGGTERLQASALAPARYLITEGLQIDGARPVLDNGICRIYTR